MVSRAAISEFKYLTMAMMAALTIAPMSVNAAKIQSQIYVLYNAPPACPDRATFLQLLSRRVAPASLADDAKLGHIVIVTLQADEETFLGRLQYEDKAGHSGTRTVRASHCEEVVSAMALVTALAIEKPLSISQDTDQSLPAGKSHVDPAAQASQATEVTPPSRVRVQRPLPPTAPVTTSTAGSSVPPAPSSARPFTHEMSLGVHVVRGVVGPGVAIGAGLEWALGPRSVVPLFRFGATWIDDRMTVTGDSRTDTVHFQLLAVNARICAGQALLAPTLLTLAICSGPELGRYRAEGAPATDSPTLGHDFDMLWASLISDLHLRVAWEAMFFDLAPSIRFPLVRRNFDAEGPSRSIHEIPFIALGAAGSLGMSF